MSMQKYTKGEGKLEVVRGLEADALSAFRARVGKAVSEFSKEELAELDKELAAARARESELNS